LRLTKDKKILVWFFMAKQIFYNKFSVGQTAKHWQISRTTVYRYLREMEQQNIIQCVNMAKAEGSVKPYSGNTGRVKYSLIAQTLNRTYTNSNINEDTIWRKDIAPFLKSSPVITGETYKKANYIIAEMLNNAIEHSEGKEIAIEISKNIILLRVLIVDNGIGIFRKIQNELNLEEKQFAILELAKGKLTTSPQEHTGQGIFFSSRIADQFAIYSEELLYHHRPDTEELLDNPMKNKTGTTVGFTIHFDSSVSLGEVFRMYENSDMSFSATNVLVKLLEYGEENPTFVSRSQARRLLARFDQFERVTLDFYGVDEIHQGFADELFRVFPQKHPQCQISAENCSGQVQGMIAHVRNTK
jgi:anti-sigma regulatory factor (Ser/Thr protein kinase)